MTHRLVVVALVMAGACRGSHPTQTGIHRELHGNGTTITGLPDRASGLAMRDATPKLEITGVTGPIADAVRSRLENNELVKKGAVTVGIRLEPATPPTSGKVAVTLHIVGVFALPPDVVKTEDTETGELVYDNATPTRLGSELGAAVLGYFTDLKLPLSEIQPPTGVVAKVQRIAAGPPHCSLHEDGTVRCWEENLEAVPIAKASDSIAIEAGNNYGACGVHANGRAWCLDAWDSTVAFEVRDVCGVEHAKDVSVGQATACALLEDGHVRCWPRSAGAFEPCHGAAAAEVAGITDAVSIDVGPFEGCAVRKDGSVQCWEHCGKGCRSGVVGSVDPSLPPKAIAIKGLAKAKQVYFSYQPCVLVGDDHVTCAAFNDAKASETVVPEPVKKVTVGIDGTCALTTTGNLDCWMGGAKPTKVDGLSDLVDVGGDIAGMCGVTSKGVVLCWGGMSGQEPPRPVLMTP